MNNLMSKYLNIKTIHSDAYKPYIKYLKDYSCVVHTTEKKYTTHIESLNSILKHRLSAFNRRTRNISKKPSNLMKLIKTFCYYYTINLHQHK